MTLDGSFKAIRLTSLVIATCLVVPVLQGWIRALDIGEVAAVVEVHGSALRNSILYPALAASTATLAAWLVASCMFADIARKRRERIAVVALAPFFSSTASRLFAWVLMFSYTGLLARALRAVGLLDADRSALTSPVSLVAALAAMYFPLAMFLFYAFGSTLKVDEEEAARLLRPGPATAMAGALAPRFRRAAWVSLGCVFLWSHASLMVPSVVGGDSGWFVSTSIEHLLNVSLRRDTAFVLANVDALLVMAVVAAGALAAWLVERAYLGRP